MLSSSFATPFGMGDISSPGRGGEHSLLGPLTELGSSPAGGGDSTPASMSALARELEDAGSSASGKGQRLAPGTFAPREEGSVRAAFVEKNSAARTYGASKRKSAPPQRHSGGPTPSGKRRQEESPGRLEAELASEREKRVEAEKSARSLRAELERERTDAAQEAERAAGRARQLRTALEKTLRSVADAEARERRRALGTAAFELGRAAYRSGAPGFAGRDVWEDGDAERELRRRAAALLARREAVEQSRSTAGRVAPIEAVADDEARRAHLAALGREEAELAAERSTLERRKLRHVREWSRVRDEDASRFRSRPLMHERYLLLKLLGKGGFSEVWLAFDLDAAREVAVKFHQLDQRWSEEKKRAYVRHAAREYSITRDLDHPRVVKLFDVFEVDDDTFATVIEFCAGDDLDALLRARRTLPEREARAIILQVLAGLRHLHAPSKLRNAIIHYDLKPGNILFDDKGDVKITDFGLAKIIPQHHDATSLELTSMGAGTYWYLPPECFAADERAPPRINPNVDVWSVGVIFYQMLYGKRPFGEGLSQKSILAERTMLRATNVDFPPRPPVSREAKDFIRLCLTPSQADRPSTKDLCDHALVTAPPAPGGAS